MALLTPFTEVPAATPTLDRAGVEAARLLRVARDELVVESPSVTYELLAQARGTSENTARQWVQRRRAAGTIVTVEHDGVVLLPSFQFDTDYDDVIPAVATITRQLAGAGLSGWAIWRWFHVPNTWIEARPVDCIATDPALVARAADRLTDAA